MHIMLDLETMSTQPNAAIVAIGAVYFDPAEGTLGKEFYQAVDLISCQQLGLHIDADTVMWWLRQSAEAREAISKDPQHLSKTLQDFTNWLPPLEEKAYVWGNGADFDNVILSSACRAAGVKIPWRFSRNSCYRTLKNQSKIPFVEPTIPHHALEDAKAQATHLIKVMQSLGLERSQ
jgi:DNA polymerase III epsilon subunit-like protein